MHHFRLIFPLLFLASLPGQTSLTCSSEDGSRTLCPANTRAGVRLLNQRSGADCIEGRTWGYDRRGIWVDEGCRADFALGSAAAGAAGATGSGEQHLTCSSENGKRMLCPIPRNSTVHLLRRRGTVPCRRQYSWGVRGNSVWVDHGCRAEFIVTPSHPAETR